MVFITSKWMLKSAFISSSVLSWLSSMRWVRDFCNNSWSILIFPSEYKHWNLAGLIFNTFRALVLSYTIRLVLAFSSSSSSSLIFWSENAHARYCWPKNQKTDTLCYKCPKNSCLNICNTVFELIPGLY